jgi:peptide/nickel transport system permease protein
VWRYVARRLLQIIPSVLILTLFMFVLMRVLPGDPVLNQAEESEEQLTDRQLEVLRHQLGLDQPLPEQYVRWLGGVLSGDWGRTITGRARITDVIKSRAPVTLQLALLTWAVTMVVAIPVGIASALKRNSWLDVTITTGALAGLATPNFVVALFMIIIFAVNLNWLPSRGYVPLNEDPIEALKHFAIPIFTLSTSGMAGIVRQTRSGMLEAMREDYVRTATAKGLTFRRIIGRHVLQNALLPIVTIAGLQIGGLISGSIIIETIFGIPGMGNLTIDAVLAQDYNMIQILVMLFAIATILGNLAADLAYTRMDPRIRLS